MISIIKDNFKSLPHPNMKSYIFFVKLKIVIKIKFEVIIKVILSRIG